MITKPPSPPVRARESPDSILAKNLVVARVIAGLTQHELASAARVSRATIAQLETGYSDPRLSTIVELARGLGVSPIVLLLGLEEVRALASLPHELTSSHVSVSSDDLGKMHRLLESGMLKDRLRAARVGAAVARDAGATDAAPLSAAICSAFIPGPGTVIGTILGRLLGDS